MMLSWRAVRQDGVAAVGVTDRDAEDLVLAEHRRGTRDLQVFDGDELVGGIALVDGEPRAWWVV